MDPDPSLFLDLQIASESHQGLPSEADILRWVGAAVGDHKSEAELTVRIVDEQEIQTLNHQYRGKNYATNVLSFPAELPPEIELPLLGDIVICRQVVEREAKDQNKCEQSHWAHMLVHGTLHLLGYDHIDDQDAETMEALEISILAQFSISNPYQSDQVA